MQYEKITLSQIVHMITITYINELYLKLKQTKYQKYCESLDSFNQIDVFYQSILNINIIPVIKIYYYQITIYENKDMKINLLNSDVGPVSLLFSVFFFSRSHTNWWVFIIRSPEKLSESRNH